MAAFGARDRLQSGVRYLPSSLQPRPIGSRFTVDVRCWRRRSRTAAIGQADCAD